MHTDQPHSPTTHGILQIEAHPLITHRQADLLSSTMQSHFKVPCATMLHTILQCLLQLGIDTGIFPAKGCPAYTND